MESFWAEMATRKHKVTEVKLFQRLAKTTKLVLVLPHSNADGVGIFSGGPLQDQGQEQLSPGWNPVIGNDN